MLNQLASAPVVDPAMIRKYDQPGPRYTSYPTADRFHIAYDAAVHGSWLAASQAGGQSRPLSLYFHLPFCRDICFYCACNKIVTRDTTRSARYVKYVKQELALVRRILGARVKVEQLHWGGGTPTFLSAAEMTDLMQATAECFELMPDGEYSIEIDPRTVTAETIATLGQLGFNRVSLGVQDFDLDVQQAIHRVQSIDQTRMTTVESRRNGMKSVNFDLIYGLPRQNPVSFAVTIDRVIELAPDRISLYSYAHLPTLFKSQRRILPADMPTPDVKLQLLQIAIERLCAAGYIYIGMDHFAKPDDELSIAVREGKLHRNFQGYSTLPDCDLIAFGISAISKVGPTYAQNVKTLDAYYAALDRGELPIQRGIELTADDLLRRAVIQALMCDFEVRISEIESAHGIQFASHFARELAQLGAFQADGLVSVDGSRITVTVQGRLLVRAICMVFDRYLRKATEQPRFSRVV